MTMVFVEQPLVKPVDLLNKEQGKCYIKISLTNLIWGMSLIKSVMPQEIAIQSFCDMQTYKM